jgi:hypothetical protein
MPARGNFATLVDRKFEEPPEETAEPPQVCPPDDYDSTLTYTEKVGRPKHGLCEIRPDGSYD